MPSHESLDVLVTVAPGDRVTIGRVHFYWGQLSELSRLVDEYREEDLPFETQIALAAYRGALGAEEDVMANLEEERYKALQNCVLTIAGQLGFPEKAPHDMMGRVAAADEIVRAADDVRAADRRLANAPAREATKAELAAEYSFAPHLHRPPLPDPSAVTVPVTVAFLTEIRSVVDAMLAFMPGRRGTMPVEGVERVLGGIEAALREAGLPEENRNT